MIAVDTNMLVYAPHRSEAPWHELARDCLVELASSGALLAVPWPCVHEFLSVVTRSPIRPPSTLKQAFGAINSWLQSGTLIFIGEGERHIDQLRDLAFSGRIRGGEFHDARIAAICVSHGISEFWTADRDFSKFPELCAVNPLA